MISTIMITGSSGTVGTALAKSLIKNGYSVIPVDIKKNIWDNKINKKTIKLDLRKSISLQLKKRPELIIHLAANARVHDLVLDPRKAIDNHLMTHHILEYARKQDINKVIFSSSREVYGESGLTAKRKEASTNVADIKSPYTSSKYASESLLHAYNDCYGIKPVIVRLSNVYGRYDVSERVIPYFIYLAKRNRDMHVFGKEKKLDFTYIDDTVDGFLRIIKRFNRIAPETFNITSGTGTKILDLATMIIKKINSSSKINIDKKRTGEITSFVADLSKAKKLLGYKPNISINDGISSNIDWYINAMKDRRVYMTQVRNLKRRGWA